MGGGSPAAVVKKVEHSGKDIYRKAAPYVNPVEHGVNKAYKDTGAKDLVKKGGRLLEDNAKYLAPTTVVPIESGNEGVKQVEKMNKAKKDAMNAAKEGADAQKRAFDDQKKSMEDAKKEKAKQEKVINEEKLAEEGGKLRDSARSRQRKLAVGARGRRSTILTTGNEQAAPGARKSLLGQ